MNSEQLKELLKLDTQGLAMLVIENGPQRFIVHRNIQNKMSHALIGEGKELFEFLDRGKTRQTAICTRAICRPTGYY